MPLTVPELHTDRFLLRAWRYADVPAALEAAGDEYIPLVTNVPPVQDELAGRWWVELQWERADTYAGYSFAITEAGRAVGMIGLTLQEEGRGSIGYWVVPSMRRRGVAAEALSRVTGWALREVLLPRLHLHVEPWNEASIRTAESAGYAREGLLRSWQWVGQSRRDVYVYAAINEEIR